jgi:type II secretory pathway component PulM
MKLSDLIAGLVIFDALFLAGCYFAITRPLLRRLRHIRKTLDRMDDR